LNHLPDASSPAQEIVAEVTDVNTMISRAKTQEIDMLPLSRFKEGERGVIVRLNGSGPFRKRLQEMGFIRGTEVLVEKYAPLRDPIELIVKGYHVSLRVDEAEHVLMEKHSGESE